MDIDPRVEPIDYASTDAHQQRPHSRQLIAESRGHEGIHDVAPTSSMWDSTYMRIDDPEAGSASCVSRWIYGEWYGSLNMTPIDVSVRSGRHIIAVRDLALSPADN